MAQNDTTERVTLTSLEVARMFDVTYQTVLRWAKNGQLPVARITPSGRYQFNRDDVEAALDRKEAS